MSDIKSATWYSVVMDEATDVSNEQSVIVYVKIAVNGELKTHFLQLVELKGCKAADIFTAASKVMTHFGLAFSKLSGISTDGASVMVGDRRGVSTLFKQKNEAIINVHCVAHRLALASSQAANDVPYLVTFQDIVNRIYKYFSHSPNRTRQLKAMEEVLGQAERKFVNVSATRWLSFAGAVNAVVTNWEVLVSVLKEDKSDVASKLLHNVTDYSFVACAAYYDGCALLFKQALLEFSDGELEH